MFPVLFAIPRTAGWLAQWVEMLGDPEQKIARPRQIYTGADERDYVPIERRTNEPKSARRRALAPSAERAATSDNHRSPDSC